MNKAELVSEVANLSDLSKTQAEKAFDAVFDSITKSLGQGEEVRLVGFGTFKVADRNASDGRNPRTGEPIKIPATRVPKFSAGKALKDAVANPGSHKRPAKNAASQKQASTPKQPVKK